MATDVTQRPLPTTANFGEPNQISAYAIIRRAEAEAQAAQDSQHLTCARVVGFMLLEFHERAHILSDVPCSTLAEWVTSPHREKAASDRDIVYELGVLLREKFIRLFRTSTSPYPPPSSHPSHPAFDTVEDMIRDILEPTKQRQTSSKRKALARDGFRCVITGFIDKTSVQNCPSLLNQTSSQGDTPTKFTIEAAHIFNESTTHGIAPEGSPKTSIQNKTEYAAIAMAVLKLFGFSGLVEESTRSGGVHEVWNLLSLDRNLHRDFDALDLWFEHTEEPNRYNVCVSDKGTERYIRSVFQGPSPHVDGAPMVVEFTSRFENAPPPNPILLALHATCARVAHMAGAAEYFDKLERDEEDIKVLARDGSNAVLLSHLLSPFGTLEVEGYVQTVA